MISIGDGISSTSDVDVEKIYIEHGALLMCIFRRHGASQEAAEDFLQETFLRLLLTTRWRDEDRPLLPWLVTVALNTMRGAIRREKTRREAIERACAQANHTTIENFLQKLMTRQVRQQVRRIVFCRLGYRRRQMLMLRLQGLGDQEIADRMGVKTPTVTHSLWKARRSLRPHLFASWGAWGGHSEK